MICIYCLHSPLYIAGRARAGCPIRNIQATLDGLTRSPSSLEGVGVGVGRGGASGGRADSGGPGLTVAVYEESQDFLAVGEKQHTLKVSLL